MTPRFYPKYTDGTLDPQSEAVLRQIEAANGTPLARQTPEEARATFLERAWLGGVEPDVAIESRKIPGPGGELPVHVYTPAGTGPFPILLFFHGGGFVAGRLDEFDPFCSMLAKGAGCVVVSVGYRLAPEHKHPAAVEDAEAALLWTARNAELINGDAARIAVAGDSAGGNLSAVCTLRAREQGFPRLVYQVLICPWLESFAFDSQSYGWFGDGLWLSTAAMEWYRGHYLGDINQALSPAVSPLRVGSVNDLPPALILTAEYDVLRSEAEMYAERLKQAGISVQYSRYNGMLHDFVILPALFDNARNAIREICSSLHASFRI